MPVTDLLPDSKVTIHVDLKFALPGKERQDSVYSGLQVLAPAMSQFWWMLLANY